MLKRNNLKNQDKSETRVFFTSIVMKKLIKVFGSMILLLLILPQVLFAQAPNIDWVKLYGNYAEGRGIQITPDGGYIACGFIGIVADEDYYLVKLNSDGDTLWTKRYDFHNAGDEVLYSIDITPDGGYITTGYGDWNGITLKCFTFKADSLGDTLWTRTYNTIPQGHSISRTSDGGYIISGDGSQMRFRLIKIDSIGNVMWTGVYGGGWAWDVQQTTDGDYIAIGDDVAGPMSHLIKVVKTTVNGDSLWAKTFWGGRGNSIRQTVDGCYIVSGYTRDFGSTLRPCLIKTDSNGDTLWAKYYPTPNSYCTGSYVRQTIDSGYIHAESGTVGLLRRTDSEGNTIWTLSLPSYGYTHIHSLQITPDKGYIVAGYDMPTSPITELYVAKTEPDPTLVGIENNNPSVPIHYSLSQNYPNPFNPQTTISYRLPTKTYVTLKIYNMLGKEVRTLVNESQSMGCHSILWDGRNELGESMASGVYYYQLKTSDEFLQTKKLLLIK